MEYSPSSISKWWNYFLGIAISRKDGGTTNAQLTHRDPGCDGMRARFSFWAGTMLELTHSSTFRPTSSSPSNPLSISLHDMQDLPRNYRYGGCRRFPTQGSGQVSRAHNLGSPAPCLGPCRPPGFNPQEVAFFVNQKLMKLRCHIIYETI
jgi:hypothetical protein